MPWKCECCEVGPCRLRGNDDDEVPTLCPYATEVRKLETAWERDDDCEELTDSEGQT